MAELKRKNKAILTVLLTKKYKIFVSNFSISDLVAVEGRYHTCCSSFENPMPKYASSGRPLSSDELTAFNTIYAKMENEFELYAAKDFQETMQKLGDDVYSVKMTDKDKIERKIWRLNSISK